MQIIISLVVAILFYKIKIIDDRKLNNYEKLKNYLKRRGEIGFKNGFFEQDEWLEKDIPFQIMRLYKESTNNEGKKRTILDYYKDYADNQNESSELKLLIVLNAFYFLSHQYLEYLGIWKPTIDLVIILSSILLCLRQPKTSLFNNPIVHIDNNRKSEKIYKKVQKAIDVEIFKCEKNLYR